MAAPAQPQNPFAGILTSQSLQERELQNAYAQAGDNRYLGQMNASMLQLRNALMQRGMIQPTPEMQKAQRNDAILQGVSKKFGEDVQNGRVDEDEAMGSMLESAMTEFLSAGDYESATVIAKQLMEKRAEQAELDKLRGEIKKTKYEIDEKLPSEVAENESTVAANEARADLYRRTNPNLRGSGGGQGGTTNKSDYGKFRENGAAVASTVQKLGDLVELYQRAPGIASDPGKVLGVVQEGVKGAKALFFTDPANAYAVPIEQAFLRDNAGRLQKAAQALNVDQALLGSLVTETAYTMAKAYDSRISNADFENALKMLGSVKDPRAAKAAFTDMAFRLRRDFKNKAGSNPDFSGEPVIQMVEDEYNDFLELATGKPRKNSVDSRAPKAKEPEAPAQQKSVADMTDEELEALANGG
jgi:hypothetical protein